MGKIFTNQATDKGLNSKIYKQFMSLNMRKKSTKKLADIPVADSCLCMAKTTTIL